MIFYEEILREFNRKKVKYVIVGGVAFNILGSFRSTHDLDILVYMTDENLAKIVKIFKKHKYHVKQPVDPMGIAEKKTRNDWIKNKSMKAFNFYRNDGLEVDIIIDSPVSFKKATKNKSFVNVSGIKLPIISIDDLIEMKKNTGRRVDQIDVQDLKKVKKYRKKNAV